jgi:predicted nucleic acid-binding Zn ribbon protein
VLELLGGERQLASGLLLGRLGRSWEAVVGGRLAEESAPAALDEGFLLIRASSSAWAAQIKFLAKEIRDGANRVLAAPGPVDEAAEATAKGHPAGPIRGIRVVVETAPRTS